MDEGRFPGKRGMGETVIVEADPFADGHDTEPGPEGDVTFQVHDQLGGARYPREGPRNCVELAPVTLPAHSFRQRRRVRTERVGCPVAAGRA